MWHGGKDVLTRQVCMLLLCGCGAGGAHPHGGGPPGPRCRHCDAGAARHQREGVSGLVGPHHCCAGSAGADPGLVHEPKYDIMSDESNHARFLDKTSSEICMTNNVITACPLLGICGLPPYERDLLSSALANTSVA